MSGGFSYKFDKKIKNSRVKEETRNGERMPFVDMALERPMFFIWLLVAIAGGYVAIWTILTWRRQKKKGEAVETDRKKKKHTKVENNGPGFEDEIRRIRGRVSFLEVEIPGIEKSVEAMVLTLPNGGTEELVKHWAEIEAKNVRLDYLRQELKDLRDILKRV